MKYCYLYIPYRTWTCISDLVMAGRYRNIDEALITGLRLLVEQNAGLLLARESAIAGRKVGKHYQKPSRPWPNLPIFALLFWAPIAGAPRTALEKYAMFKSGRCNKAIQRLVAGRSASAGSARLDGFDPSVHQTRLLM